MEEVAINNRYERKFFISDMSKHEIEKLIRLHPANFNEIFYQRYINSIYLDSYGMDSYHENVNGIANRKKVRIRWYGKLLGEIQSPTLEFKIKRGLVGFKKGYKMPPFCFSNDFNKVSLENLCDMAELPLDKRISLDSLRPVLVNRYKRKYFLSGCKRFRLTLDSEMSFGALGLFTTLETLQFTDYQNCIVEMKYFEKDADYAPEISNNFPYRMTRSSKYVTAVNLLGIL